MDDLEWPHAYLAIGRWLANGLLAEAPHFSTWPLILQQVSTDLFTWSKVSKHSLREEVSVDKLC